MNTNEFQTLLQPVTNEIAGKRVDDDLASELGRQFPPGCDVYEAMEEGCHQAISDGWTCSQGGEGQRFGGVIEPSVETNALSVDAIDLKNIVGPHHRHPRGEICMVMPVTAEALVLYMQPGGVY